MTKKKISPGTSVVLYVHFGPENLSETTPHKEKCPSKTRSSFIIRKLKSRHHRSLETLRKNARQVHRISANVVRRQAYDERDRGLSSL